MINVPTEALFFVMEKHQVVIDGNSFSTLEEFFDEVDRALNPKTYWGKNLDAFNDVLSGGFGTSSKGFALCGRTPTFRGLSLAILKL